MKKFFVVALALVLTAMIALIGCEKKAEAPKPVGQPAMTPAPAPAPAPAPVPAKPAKK